MKSHADLYANTAKLEDLIPRAEAGEFDAIFYVGGYGPMFDIVDSPASAKIIQVLYANKKLLTGVCHGPAAFAHVNKPSTQEPLLKGHKVTGVSNKECELLFPVSGIVEPWSVERRAWSVERRASSVERQSSIRGGGICTPVSST